MFDCQLYSKYRRLTTTEREAAEKAILWLSRQRLDAHTIALLSERSLDRESKTLYVAIDTKHIVYYRKIRYKESPLEFYLESVLPHLKIQRWLFPKQGWAGRNPSFGFHVHAKDAEKFLKDRQKTILTFHKRYGNIKVSAKKKHIQKQIMVGRRIALRA